VNIQKVFAYNLRKYRNHAGLHRTYISAIECGKRIIKDPKTNPNSEFNKQTNYCLECFFNNKISKK